MFKVRIHQWNLKKYVKSEDKNINIMVRSGRAANHRLGNTAQSSGEPGSILLGQRQHYEEEKPVTKATANWRKLFAGMREKNFLSPPAGMITNTQEAQPIQGNEPQGGIECRSPIRSQLSSPPISTPFRACQGYQEPDPVGLPAPSHRPISSQAPTPKNSFYDYDEESDARRKRRKVSTINSTTPLETRTLACPFYKHNPLRYNPSTMRFRTCAGPGWDSISRLRYLPHLK